MVTEGGLLMQPTGKDFETYRYECMVKAPDENSP